MIQTRDTKLFFKYVFPSILSFALSGVYAIVDGFFVGNSLGDVGLSAVNIAYPIVAFIQAVGTGIGMGGANLLLYQQSGEKGKRSSHVYSGSKLVDDCFQRHFNRCGFMLVQSTVAAFGSQRQDVVFGRRIYCGRYLWHDPASFWYGACPLDP